MFTVGDLNNNLFSCFISRVTAVGASLIPRKSLVLRIFSVLEKEGERGEGEGERGRNCDEDVLTTGNLVVLQLEFPFSLLVVFFFFICIDVPLEIVCFGNKEAGVG